MFLLDVLTPMDAAKEILTSGVGIAVISVAVVAAVFVAALLVYMKNKK
jgi:hypothetical protein